MSAYLANSLWLPFRFLTLSTSALLLHSRPSSGIQAVHFLKELVTDGADRVRAGDLWAGGL